jgi:hypothetical protein
MLYRADKQADRHKRIWRQNFSKYSDFTFFARTRAMKDWSVRCYGLVIEILVDGSSFIERTQDNGCI